MLLRRWKQSFWEVVYIYREEGRQHPHLYLVVNPCGAVNPQPYIVYIYMPYKGCPYSLVEDGGRNIPEASTAD